MHDSAKTPRPRGLRACTIAAAILLLGPAGASAGGLSWLDDVLRQIVADTRSGAKSAARSAAELKIGRLFTARQADRGLETLVQESADLARTASRIDQPAQALLDARFGRLIGDDAARTTFRELAPAEKRLVVEMGETVANLARRHPQEAEAMIRRLGPDGLMAVRAFGDDVAGVLAQEGPECLTILRRTGRSGWEFFTGSVLPHKKKLVAAGVLAAFLADPDRFVDSLGRATDYAVREFARAGVTLAAAAGAAGAAGLDDALASHGFKSPIVRAIAMCFAGLVAALAFLALVGIPARTALRPLTWALRRHR